MTNPYYTRVFDVTPGNKVQSQALEDEFTRINTGFDLISALFAGFAPLASPTFTGTPSGPTAAPGTSTTQFATTAYVAISYAPLASPTFTGVPSGPTAAPGTSTTQFATTAFVQAAAFNAALPAQTGNAGKFVTTDGSTASWTSLPSVYGYSAFSTFNSAFGAFNGNNP